MSAEPQFKRNIAYKVKIENLFSGNSVIDNERFSHLNLDNKKVIRVNIVGSIVDKYNSDGDKKYLFLTLDDGSGQIKLKTFGDDVERFSFVMQGQTVVVIGTLRFFNNELYVSPEIIKECDPRYLLVRKFELEKIKTADKPMNDLSLKERVVDLIKNSESNGGININDLLKIGNSNEINQEIQKLLEEGIIFEPRPGVLRWLG